MADEPIPPPAKPTTPPPPPPPKVDPYFAKMAKTLLNSSVDDATLNLKPLDEDAQRKIVEAPNQVALGDMAVASARATAAAKKEATPPAAPPATTEPPAPTTPPPPAPTTPPAAPATTPPTTPPAPAVTPAAPADITVKRSTADEVLAIQEKISQNMLRLSQPQPPAAPVATTQPAAPVVPTADDQYDATLPEENREVLSLLKWADKLPEYKGKATEFRNWVRRFDEFLKTNPDEEKITEFKNANRSPVSDSILRKLDRERTIEIAEERATVRIRKESDEEIKKLRQNQAAIEQQLSGRTAFDKIRASLDIKISNPTVQERLPAEAITAILSNDAAAIAKYPIEAPIVQRHKYLAEKCASIMTFQEPYDDNNRDHQWIDGLLKYMEDTMKQRPAGEQLRNGRAFLTMLEYGKAMQTDPQAGSKYWTFELEDIVNRIIDNGHLAALARRKAIREEAKKMGMVDPTEAAPPTKPAAEPPKPAQSQPAPPATPMPPKGGASISPGSADTKPAEPEYMKTLELLHPSSRLLLGRK